MTAHARLLARDTTPAPEYPSPAVIRRDAAKRDARAKFYDGWMKLLAERAAAEAEIDRRFRAGEFR